MIDFDAPDLGDIWVWIDWDHVVARLVQHPEDAITELGFICARPDHGDRFYGP